MLDNETAQLKRENEQLKKEIASLAQEKDEQYRKYLVLESQFLVLQRKLFGKSSEKLSKEEQEQQCLFNEAEEYCTKSSDAGKKSVVVIKEHIRAKCGKKKLPADLPREDEIHDLPEEEKICKCCKKSLIPMGEEITEEADIIPAKIYVKRHRYIKYAPCNCKESQDCGESKIKKAPAVKRMIKRGIYSAGFLAYFLVHKFCDALPFYRQEKIFKRIGIDISRETLCNLAILISSRCQDILELMWEEIRGGPLIQMDETGLRVIEETAGKSPYMWVALGGNPEKKTVIYHYHPTRNSEIVKNLLEGYQGYIQTDGLPIYNIADALPGVVHVGCFAHVRRLFKRAMDNNKKNPGSIHAGFSFITELYRIEKQLRALYPDDENCFNDKRSIAIQPVLSKFHKWLSNKQLSVVPSSDLGKAISYTLKEWRKLIRYIEKPFLTPDNNLAENAIRPFVVGRKNWLFSYNPRGAHASACLYSLIESAKLNRLEPYWYLKYLFTYLPLAKTKEELKELLPSCINIAAFTAFCQRG